LGTYYALIIWGIEQRKNIKTPYCLGVHILGFGVRRDRQKYNKQHLQNIKYCNKYYGDNRVEK
jgi:hypothetical protein